jgi:DNA-nicking Smr family endonuclease
VAAKKKGGGPFEGLRSMRDELAKRSTREGASAAGAPPAPARVRRNETAPKTGPEDEALLLHRLFAGVQPLDRSRGGRVPKQRVERSEAVERVARRGADAIQADADAVLEHLRVLVEGQARFEVADDGRRVEGRRADLPLEALRRLRRGRLPIDARLDLHGLGVRDARVQLESFLRTMRARGERCVLVIHGKGEHSPHGAAVLRGEIAAWLSQGSASEHVAAFSTAEEGDGGEGAVYVLLRK